MRFYYLIKGKTVDVTCSCGFEFCFLCKLGPHAPSICAQAKLWRSNVDESQALDKAVKKMIDKTETWKANNTRPCPQCKCPIQKNHGCNHMTCLPSAGGCGYEFCCVCMANWKTLSLSLINSLSFSLSLSLSLSFFLSPSRYVWQIGKLMGYQQGGSTNVMYIKRVILKLL